MTLEEFRKRFNEIRDMGFVQSLRKGSTGVGYTFEELLGIEENNIRSSGYRKCGNKNAQGKYKQYADSFYV